MRGVTAHMLVGSAPEADRGFEPSHLLLFSESPDPAWKLISLDRDDSNVTWRTASGAELEAGLLMAGLLAFQDKSLLKLVDPEQVRDEQWLAGIEEGVRSSLVDTLRGLSLGRIQLAVEEESSLVAQLGQLSRYTVPVELYLPGALHRTMTRI